MNLAIFKYIKNMKFKIIEIQIEIERDLFELKRFDQYSYIIAINHDFYVQRHYLLAICSLPTMPDCFPLTPCWRYLELTLQITIVNIVNIDISLVFSLHRMPPPPPRWQSWSDIPFSFSGK